MRDISGTFPGGTPHFAISIGHRTPHFRKRTLHRTWSIYGYYSLQIPHISYLMYANTIYFILLCLVEPIGTTGTYLLRCLHNIEPTKNDIFHVFTHLLTITW